MQYLNARYYDPELGLFLQPDWFEVTKAGVGTNRYSYSFNDPVNLMDPGGNNAAVGYLANIVGSAATEIVIDAFATELLGGTYTKADLGRSAYVGAVGGATGSVMKQILNVVKVAKSYSKAKRIAIAAVETGVGTAAGEMADQAISGVASDNGLITDVGQVEGAMQAGTVIGGVTEALPNSKVGKLLSSVGQSIARKVNEGILEGVQRRAKQKTAAAASKVATYGAEKAKDFIKDEVTSELADELDTTEDE